MDYEEYLDKRKMKENTKEAYIKDLEQFKVFLGKEDVNKAKKTDVIKYIIHLQKERYSDRSIARKIASLKKYFYFATNMGLVKRDPTFDIDSPKIKIYKDKLILDKEKILEFIDSPLVFRGKDFLGLRDHLMFKIIFVTGINILDLLELNKEDVDRKSGYIISGESLLYLHDDTIEKLETYINMIDHRYPGNEKLFINYSGESLSRQGVWKIFNTYSKKLGFEKNITAQMLINNSIYYNN